MKMNFKKVIIALIIIALIIFIFNPFGLKDKIMGNASTDTAQ